MKRTAIKLASKVLGIDMSKTTMTARYFVNALPDAAPGPTPIPEESIRKSVLDISNAITANFPPVDVNGDEGLYLGTAGVAYMYYHLSKIPAFADQRSKFLSLAVDYLKPAVNVANAGVTRESEMPSFILGNGGVNALAGVIYKAVGEIELSNEYMKLFHSAANTCKEMRFLSCGSDELFVGRAGYICGALWLSKETNTPLQKQDLHEICRVTVSSGREYSQRHRSGSPLMYAYYKVEYLGAAHGLCAILQMLMSVPDYLDANPIDAHDVKNSVDYLLRLQDAEGNFPCSTDEIRHNENELVHWCHGAAGIVYLMAKAYLIWHEDKYLKSCKKTAEIVWQKGLLRKGPGLCHGVAGNGYVFLLLYRLTNDEKYLHRAVAFANFMETDDFKQNARTPDNPYSLYEGIAGTACYLADICCPSKAAFPFSDVF